MCAIRNSDFEWSPFMAAVCYKDYRRYLGIRHEMRRCSVDSEVNRRNIHTNIRNMLSVIVYGCACSNICNGVSCTIEQTKDTKE